MIKSRLVRVLLGAMVLAPVVGCTQWIGATVGDVAAGLLGTGLMYLLGQQVQVVLQ